MSAHLLPLEIAVAISDERRDALLGALRRGDRREALELLEGWPPPYDCDPGEGWFHYLDLKIIELTDWTRDECRLHVEAGRFQHALALLDRYLIPPAMFTHAGILARLERMKS